jgi:hypothetical protein
MLFRIVVQAVQTSATNVPFIVSEVGTNPLRVVSKPAQLNSQKMKKRMSFSSGGPSIKKQATQSSYNTLVSRNGNIQSVLNEFGSSNLGTDFQLETSSQETIHTQKLEFETLIRQLLVSYGEISPEDRQRRLLKLFEDPLISNPLKLFIGDAISAETMASIGLTNSQSFKLKNHSSTRQVKSYNYYR